MKRNALDYIDDVLNEIGKIEGFCLTIKNFDEFRRNEMLVYACIRALEVIGEAVKNIPPDLKEKHPEIPWRDIAGTRDVLIHDYIGVDMKVVWKTVKEDIPKIKPLFEKLKQS